MSLGRSAGRIGPNAITRIAEALEAEAGSDETKRVFLAAGLEQYIETPPEEMVRESEVTRLHRALREELGLQAAASISRAGGQLTGAYLLARRIPAAAQHILHLLPPAASARILLSAIAKHSWTFCGSGTFHHAKGHPLAIFIRGCPICRDAGALAPICDYYAATFEHIFRALVSRRSSVRETTCHAAGASACTFEVRWR